MVRDITARTKAAIHQEHNRELKMHERVTSIVGLASSVTTLVC
jgi:hypothetical protein